MNVGVWLIKLMTFMKRFPSLLHRCYCLSPCRKIITPPREGSGVFWWICLCICMQAYPKRLDQSSPNSFVCPPGPWLGPAPATWWYVMYFRFYEWHPLFHNGSYWRDKGHRNALWQFSKCNNWSGLSYKAEIFTCCSFREGPSPEQLSSEFRSHILDSALIENATVCVCLSVSICLLYTSDAADE